MSRKWEKLSQAEVIQLFKDGVYKVDLENGLIIKRDGKPIATRIKGGRYGTYYKVRLYDGTKMREMTLHAAVWTGHTLREIPEGFEIHHRDKDHSNNRWTNLFCLFKLDHRKLHDSEDLLEHEETPF